jgi:hypothetical protein
MNTINLHIDETLGRRELDILRAALLSTSHVRDVHYSTTLPHDMLVEFDEHENVPMHVLGVMKEQGLHADIVGC